MAATISKKVNIGSGYVYDVILNESFPAEKTIANLKTWLDTAIDDDNRIGNIKGGFKTDITTSTISDKDDMGEIRVDELTGEDGKISFALFNSNAQTIERIYPTAKYEEADIEGKKWGMVSVGGIGNKTDEQHVIVFRHPSTADGDTIIIAVGKNMEGFSDEYKPDGVTPLSVAYNIQPVDNTGRLFFKIDVPKGYEWPGLKKSV